MGRPPKAKTTPGFYRQTPLTESLGVLRLELVSANVFALRGRDRALVFAIIDLLDAFDKAAPAVEGEDT